MRIVQLLSIVISSLPSSAAFKRDTYRVLEVGEQDLITVRESEKLSLKRRGVGFIDVTDHLKFPWPSKENNPIEVTTYTYPVKTSEDETVKRLGSLVDVDVMHGKLAKLCSFLTRYYKSHEGYESAQWLSSTLHNISAELPDDIVIIEHFDHEKWKQFSIIVKIKGTETPDNIIIIGSHHDSMNLIFPSIMAGPGADDNGSGTVTNLEAFRIYAKHLAGGHLPKNTIEFHFYSAEEGGLLGSMDVFTSYREQGKRVVAMIQQDMTGYVLDKHDEHVGIVTDFSDAGLIDFLKLMVNSYLSIPYRETQCGYACSDHGSATRNGFPSSFVLESEYDKTNKYIHSTMDTLDRLSFDHMREHVKLSIGAVIELANWEFRELS